MFQAVQFSISTHFSSIWSIDRALSGSTTPRQIGVGSDGNKEALRILQSSSITGASTLDCLVSYPGNSLLGVYPSVDVGVFYSTSRLGSNKQHKDQQNNNNWKTEIGRKTTVRIFQAANKRNLIREELDMAKERKP